MSLIRIGLGLLLLVTTMSQMLQPVQGRRKLCGDALSDALDLICVNGFSRRLKRSDHAATQDRKLTLIRQLQMSETETDDEPPAGGSGRKLRRHRRRIAHECCKGGCTYDDILAYCA